MPHARGILTETGATPVKPGVGLGKFGFSNSEHAKTDAEALQDWESEGGASAPEERQLNFEPTTFERNQLLTR